MNAQAKVVDIAVLVLNTYQPKTRQDIVNSIVSRFRKKRGRNVRWCH